MKVIIEITLGNDAMQTGIDVQQAIKLPGGSRKLEKDDCGTIRDINGNTVGKWWVAK